MKLNVMSDLHIEISEPKKPTIDSDVIVLAGDIWLGLQGIYWARQTWPDKEIIYISGNHEYYGSIRPDMLDTMRLAAKNRSVHFLENDEVIISGVRFLGCTLWTNFELFGNEKKSFSMQEAKESLHDYHVIRESLIDRFTPEDALQIHTQSLEWLTNKLNEQYTGKTVVVTHHLPSLISLPYRFKQHELSPAYASHLDYLFGKADLWIHGHTHDTVDYLANGTRVVCNPRGYSWDGDTNENLDFDENFIVEI